ncbi:MAG: glycosyltransferase [Nanoarchaeota archaeon]|nr:glycosyltransferase [Nanoarchaeota archaeon]
MKVGIIMPAYNEERRIGSTLSAYSKFLNSKLKKNKFDYTIIVVINGTTDGTKKIVQSARKKNKRVDYIDLVKGGKGYAIIEGFKIALNKKYDLIGFVDADMATPPEAFYSLVENIGDSGGIIASRYIKGSIVNPKQIPARILASRIFNFIVRSLFFMPYRDTQCGAKIVRKEALTEIINDLGDTQWSFDIDLLFRLKKNKIFVKEWPTVWKDQKDSKLNLKKVSVQMFFSILQLRIMNSPFRRFLKVTKPIARRLWRLLRSKK